MSSKTCFKCGGTKSLSAFYAHSQMADGHLNKCIECTKLDARSHRERNIERIRARDRERDRGPRRPGYAAKYRTEHPERRAAQVMVGNAIRDGRIMPMPCLVCGGRAHAHHPDYSRPLDVVWLCPVHHKQAHALAERGQGNTIEFGATGCARNEEAA